jgi:hypothetical protein
MKKKQKLIAFVIIILALVAGVILYSLHHPKDECTQHDRDINNCVPAGKCAPPGIPDTTIDCDNSREHTFNLNK